MKGITFRPMAVVDYDGITSTITDANPAAAKRFQQAVEAALELLLRLPALGPQIELTHPAIPALRVWQLRRFKKYLIFYRPTAEGIEVIRILHGARQWEEAVE